LRYLFRLALQGDRRVGADRSRVLNGARGPGDPKKDKQSKKRGLESEVEIFYQRRVTEKAYDLASDADVSS
jgi:hypothetical protein